MKKAGKGFVPLLVGNDPNWAHLMVRAFERADVFAPLPFLRSTEEAIAFLSEAGRFKNRARLPSPSLVLLDAELPGESGWEVLKWIRSGPMVYRLPVVMMSHSSDPRQVRRAYDLGANSYLLKPTAFDELVDLVTGLKHYWGATNEVLEP